MTALRLELDGSEGGVAPYKGYGSMLASETDRAETVTALPTPRYALILFGSPGSGKGTQSKFLVEWLGIPQISTGDMLRDQMRRGTEFGKSIGNLMRSGQLVPDELVNGLVAERIAQADCERGFILDGYPRTRQQAEVVLHLLHSIGVEEVVIHLIVGYTLIISRMQGRRVCPECGTLYNAASRPPKVEGICDVEGEVLAIREDDREDVVRARLNEYERLTHPLLQFFGAESKRMFNVDASHERPEVVFGKIQALLQDLRANS